jgi:hypothetical protein
MLPELKKAKTLASELPQRILQNSRRVIRALSGPKYKVERKNLQNTEPDGRKLKYGFVKNGFFCRKPQFLQKIDFFSKITKPI